MVPVIGITTYARDETTVQAEGIEDFYALRSDYVDALRRAGAAPILLPPGEPHPQRWLELCDGILFSGGCDIDPARYGGNRDHPKLGPLSKERDTAEFIFLEILMKTQHPLLMICRGAQLLNVAMGGSLYEHIADARPENLHQGTDTIWTLHDILQTESGTTLTGRSGHHQGINRLGEGLAIKAVAADGIIEAVELKGPRFAKAVQWHPEMTAATDPAQQALFNEFVDACRRPS